MVWLQKCTHDKCSIRELCANYMMAERPGELGAIRSRSGNPKEVKVECDVYWPTDKLLGQDSLHKGHAKQQASSDKHWKSRSGRPEDLQIERQRRSQRRSKYKSPWGFK